jgi:hypothetical protein
MEDLDFTPRMIVAAEFAGKPRVLTVYLGGLGVYHDRCGEIAAAGYEGFTLLPETVQAGLR